MKKIILAFVALLALNIQIINAQSKEFIGGIYLGDTLEKCIANGTIESSGSPSFTWELSDPNIKRYFPYSTVIFDHNNIIKEIKLNASRFLYDTKHVDVAKSFNYILRYLSQRYTGMKRTEIKGNKAHFYDVGTEHTWNTSNFIIKVRYYEHKHDGGICSTIPKGAIGVCMDDRLTSGTFVDVKITRR